MLNGHCDSLRPEERGAFKSTRADRAGAEAQEASRRRRRPSMGTESSPSQACNTAR